MDEDAFNQSIRKFLKHFGVTAQREIEIAIRKAIEEGKLRGDETVPVRATLVVDGLLRDYHVDGAIILAAPPAPTST
jgi:ribosomal protein L1